MNNRPLILITSGAQVRGAEFADASISLSNAYPRAVVAAGGVPVVAACEPDSGYAAAAVARCDGVLLTGGEDIQPELHAPDLPAKLRATVRVVEPERDVFELECLREVFRQRKPLLAICRGHQLLNVAFGGTLFVDLATQVPGEMGHRRLDRKDEPVHDITLERGSRLARLLRATRVGVNSTHHQAVDRLAELFAVTARSTDGVVEAMELAPRHAGVLPWLLSVQFHPERLVRAWPRFRALFRHFVRACAEAAAAGAGRRRLSS
jgi:putative glutamine amidotransferase